MIRSTRFSNKSEVTSVCHGAPSRYGRFFKLYMYAALAPVHCLSLPVIVLFRFRLLCDLPYLAGKDKGLTVPVDSMREEAHNL